MNNKPVFVRVLTEAETQVLEKAKRDADACRMKRAQMLLASSRGLTTFEIEKQFGYSAEYARQMIHRFNEQGINCLSRKSSAPLTVKPFADQQKREQIKHMMHQSPRNFGKSSSVWTLTLVAEVLAEQGVSPRRMANETIRAAIKSGGISWKRAKDWIASPDPNYELKKTARSADPSESGK